MKVNYDFTHDVFRKMPMYKRLAREHMSIIELKSDRVKWRVVEAESVLRIPVRYEIDYHVKSIIGIDEQLAPEYGEKHTVEIRLPRNFMRSNFAAKTLTPVWHPNIKFDNPNKGHICTNERRFGRGYNLYLLVLRIGEIIQYKNYLAENVWPYPDDKRVAEWVLSYGEPNGLMGMRGKQPVDNSNLLEYTPVVEPERKLKITKVVRSAAKIKDIKRKR